MADPHHVPAVVIALPAEIDMANAGRAGQQLGSAIAPGVKAVIADMTATTFCDSSGIAMLVRAHRQAVAHGTELRLVVRSAAVLRAVTLARLSCCRSTQAWARPWPWHRNHTMSDHGPARRLPAPRGNARAAAVTGVPGDPGRAPADGDQQAHRR